MFTLAYVEQPALFNTWNTWGNSEIPAVASLYSYQGAGNSTVATTRVNAYPGIPVTCFGLIDRSHLGLTNLLRCVGRMALA